MTAKKTMIRARVLIAITLEDVPYQPNDVISASEEILASDIEAGTVTTDKAALDYCAKKLRSKPISHARRVKELQEQARRQASGDSDGEIVGE